VRVPNHMVNPFVAAQCIGALSAGLMIYAELLENEALEEGNAQKLANAKSCRERGEALLSGDYTALSALNLH